MEKHVKTQQRPVHLDLTRMKFPIMAIVSGLHRITGVLLFLLLPLALYLLHHSLQSQVSFAQLHAFVKMPVINFLIWLMLSAVGYHLLAGIRHMLMDCGFGEQLKSARVTSYCLILLAIIIAIAAGVWIWA